MVSFLAAVSIRSLVLAAVAAMAMARVKSPAARHAVWTLVTAGMLAIAVASATLPAVSVRVLAPAAVKPASGRTKAGVLVAGGSMSTRPATSRPRAASLPYFPWQPAIYAAGLLIFAARLTYGYYLTRKLVGSSTPIPRFDNVYQSEIVSVPLTVGWLRPKILLPAGWDDWGPEKLTAVLVHERNHVQRADWAIAVLAGVNRCVFWFHPLAWWLESRLKVLAEQACDDASLGQVASRECYAQVLVEMASAVRTGEGRVGWEAMAMAKTTEVNMRVDRILDESRRIFPGMTRRRWALMALIALPLVYLAAVARPARVRAQEAPARPPAVSAPTATPAPADDDLKSAHAVLADVEAEIAKFQSENVGHLPEQLQANAARLQALQMQLGTANQNLSQIQMERQRMESQLASLNTLLDYQRETGGGTLEQLEQHLQNLQSELAAANQQYGPNHPAIRRLQQQLSVLEHERQTARARESGGAKDLEQSIATLDTGLQGLNRAMEERLKQVEVLNRAVGQYQARLQTLPQLETSYANLLQQYTLAQQRFQELTRATAGPILVSRRDPEYTTEARKGRIEGKVELSVTVGTDGVPRDIEVTRGLGAGLNQQAIECVKAWRFHPATRNGEPVTAFILVEVPFRLL